MTYLVRQRYIYFLLVLCTGNVFSSNLGRAQGVPFDAKHIERNGTVLFDGAPVDVFTLLEPRGKPLWATGWNVEFLYPPTGDAVPGAVVRQTHRSGAVYQDWLLSEYDPPRRIKYVISVPEMEIWEFDISLEPAGQEKTRVTVHHRITSLAEEVNPEVQRFADTFDQYLIRWHAAINTLLKGE